MVSVQFSDESTKKADLGADLGADRKASRETESETHRDRKRRRLRTLRRSLAAIAVLGAGAGAALALRPRPVPVDVAVATKGALVVAVEDSGMTRIKDRFVVSAPVTGGIARLAFEPDDVVREGDVLVEIAPAASPLLDERARAEAEARLGAALSALGQARAQTSRADAEKQFADQELVRTEKLASSGSIAPQLLDQARFAATTRAAEVSSALFATRVAQEEVRIARASLGRGPSGRGADHHVDVLSPVSGRVLRVHQKSAAVVAAGTPLLEVGDPTALEIIVDLLTTDAVRVSPGTEVTIDGWGGDRPLAGRVRRIEPSAFTRPSALGVDEQRVNIIIAITEPPEAWSSLRDGYHVQAHLVLWRGENVLRVPHGAVFRHGDGWATFRVTDGVAHMTPVILGHRGDTEVEITSGLTPSAVVAVHPGDRVKDGVRVEPR